MKVINILTFSLFCTLSLCGHTLANEVGQNGIAANNGLNPHDASTNAGGNKDEVHDLTGVDDQGPAAPNLNAEEESVEDKEFLNTTESSDFQEIEVEE